MRKRILSIENILGIIMSCCVGIWESDDDVCVFVCVLDEEKRYVKQNKKEYNLHANRVEKESCSSEVACAVRACARRWTEVMIP